MCSGVHIGAKITGMNVLGVHIGAKITGMNVLGVHIGAKMTDICGMNRRWTISMEFENPCVVTFSLSLASWVI